MEPQTPTSGPDILIGGMYNDVIHGLGGNDYIFGDFGNDTLYGDDGNDTIYGEYGDDYISGGIGADDLDGGADEDYISGGGENDTIRGGYDDDTIYGDAGDDALYGDGGNDWVYGGAGNDVLYAGSNFDTLDGGIGDDVFALTADLDWQPLIFTGAFGTGADNFIGGADIDIIAFLGAPNHVTTPLIEISGISGVEAIVNYVPSEQVYTFVNGTLDLTNVTLFDIAGMWGGSTDDTLIGSPTYDRVTLQVETLEMVGWGGNDTLIGTSFGDKLDGGDGLDALAGGAGNDTLIGGTGADLFFFFGGDGSDKILDFADGSDKIAVGQDIVGITRYSDVNGDALLEFEDINANLSYVTFAGIAPNAIDGSDLIFA